MADFVSKQGDTGSVFSDTLTYDDGTAIDLTGAAVAFVMRAQAASVPTVNATATVVSAAAGTVKYTMLAADTLTAGTFAQIWSITFGDGTIQTVPTDGYNTVEIQENLTSTNQTIVELDELKDYLNLPAGDRSRDGELMRFIHAAQPVIEHIVGPIVPQVLDEWYDGGNYFVQLRHGPGLHLMACSEFRGPIEYPLSIVPDPARGTTYSVMYEKSLNRVVRRTTGGGTQQFPQQSQAVHVVYQAGYTPIPANIRMGALELIRANYQQTQQSGRPQFGSGLGEEQVPGSPMLGFFVPGRVRELLAPNRRFPSIA